MMRFFSAVTKRLTPLFNTKELHKVLSQDLILNQGLWRSLETQLPKRVPLEVKQILDGVICEVATQVYPSSIPLYTHIDFLQEISAPLKQWTPPHLPSLPVFLERINWCLQKKIPYLWGGNTPLGTSSLYQLYPGKDSRIRFLQGVDCSGLIYWATRGATSRNTSGLIKEGTGVNIEGLSSIEIALKLKPGMLIVWKGHVLIMTKEGIVDSSPKKGVSFTPTQDKIDEIRQTREPLNEWPMEGNPSSLRFVIRDLYPAACNHGSD